MRAALTPPAAPLLLKPHFAERIWGGSRLGPGIGEAWDLSVHPNGPSQVASGPWSGRTLAELAGAHPEAFGGPIDLLAKRLDCAQTLSVQVHPKKGDPKTEAWVVLEADRGAGVYHGFARPTSAEEVRRSAQDKTLPSLLRFLETRRGDAVFVPSGTVHAIGAGLFLFEIQQSSDTTFRIFDWGRPRELHLDAGLACSDFDAKEATPVPRHLPGQRVRLLECDHFHVERVETSAPAAIDPGARWKALFVVEGAGTMDGVAARAGETLLLPSPAGRRQFRPGAPTTLLAYGPGR